MPTVQKTDADRPVPNCPKCGRSKVVPIHAVRIRQGAHCYTCKDCGHMFGACAEVQPGDKPRASARSG